MPKIFGLFCILERLNMIIKLEDKCPKSLAYFAHLGDKLPESLADLSF